MQGMQGKIMYCALPTRLRRLSRKVKNIARSWGYSPIVPFDIGPFEDFEGGAIGRERTIAFMLHILEFPDICVGVFGISDGVMRELKKALYWKNEIRVHYGLDPKWEKEYEKLKPIYGDLLAQLRGSKHLIALVGPRAVGKTFWSDKLLRRFGLKLRRVRNTATRQPRDEADRHSYYFVSKEEFEDGIQRGQFQEYDFYQGNYYGSSLSEIRSVLKQNSGIFAITPKGAEALYKLRFEINLAILLLAPASPEVLRRNLIRREVYDEKKQEKLIRDAENFKLPPEIEHKVIKITGEMEKDEPELLAAISPLIL